MVIKMVFWVGCGGREGRFSIGSCVMYGWPSLMLASIGLKVMADVCRGWDEFKVTSSAMQRSLDQRWCVCVEKADVFGMVEQVLFTSSLAS